jgi:hypothetical protein
VDPDSLIHGYRAVIASLACLVLFVAAPIPIEASPPPVPRTMNSSSLTRVAGAARASRDHRSASANSGQASEEGRRGRNRPGKGRDAPRAGLSAFEGLGAWIDIYDAWPWAHPVAATDRLRRRGVRTIFLQTSNYGARHGIVRPRRVAQFLQAAHRRHMEVVAWYVPSFSRSKRDLRRSLRAIRFRGGGERFDGFGLDIEATRVGNISVRNERLLRLSDRIRRKAGNDFPLAAVTPDPLASLYWPRFPWGRVARRFDVLVPMGYFSFHASGYREVLGYTTRAIRRIRRATRQVRRPIHLIGGIGGDAGSASTRAFVRAVKRTRLIGASFYDAPVTTAAEWAELGVLAGREAPKHASRRRGKAVRRAAADRRSRIRRSERHRNELLRASRV